MRTHAPTSAPKRDAVSAAPLQRASAPTARAAETTHAPVPPIVDAVMRSQGSSLDPVVRDAAEARLHVDFSRVRVHTDDTATRSADAVGALAYTVGSHIAFARGQYQPRTAAGAQLLRHELVHVAQQGAHAAAAPRAEGITKPDDASEREAHALAASGNLAGVPARATSMRPMLARYDVKGAQLQQERNERSMHGQSPDTPGVAFDQKSMEDFYARNPQRQVTRPGDSFQQGNALPYANLLMLWNLPRIQDRIKRIAEETEARERAATQSGGTVTHTAANMLDYWKKRFLASVDYILYARGGDHREKLLKELAAEENKLIKAAPADLIERVDALRAKFADQWRAQIDRAADQYITIADNEGQFLTVHQNAKPVSIYGLPERVEGTVDAAGNAGTMVKTSTPVAPTVIDFIEAVQKESGLKVKADNYPDHEKHSPYLGDVSEVGKYSFDVDLSGMIKINADGFYEREPLVRFFLAVDRGARAKRIAWIALYNDFEVARTVNEKLGSVRIGFSGGGSPKGGKEGSIHHGPAPYILHVHFNVMPIDTAAQFIAGKGTPPHIDLGN